MSNIMCEECGWTGDKPLSAPSPFDDNDIITACPECLEVCRLVLVCEVVGCTKKATCGILTRTGYIHCCGKHFSGLQK